MESEKIYLYLAKRNKNGIMILMTLGEGICLPTRLNDQLYTLGLPNEKLKHIERLVKSNRITSEIWIESAVDYRDLRSKLHKRGYKGMPISDKPAIFPATIDASAIQRLPNQKKMMRRGQR